MIIIRDSKTYEMQKTLQMYDLKAISVGVTKDCSEVIIGSEGGINVWEAYKNTELKTIENFGAF